MVPDVSMMRLPFLLLLFVWLGCYPCFSDDAGDVPTKKQVEQFRKGDFEAFAAFLKSFGKGNNAVMACVYKVSWTPSEKSGISKGVCTFQATVVRTNDVALPVGRRVEWVIYVEEPGSLPEGQVERWTALSGEIVYIVNPPVHEEASDSFRAYLNEPVFFIWLGASPAAYGHAAMYCSGDDEEE